MQPVRTFIGCRAFNAVTRRRTWVGAELLLATVGSGCSLHAQVARIEPRLTPSSHVQAVRTTMAPVRSMPERVAPAPPLRVTVRWRHSYEGSGTPLPPMLMLIDGVPLGVRPDSSVDHAAAKRLLQQIRCRDVVSIQVVQGAEALRRFGRAADPGAILITTASHAWRAQAGNP